MNDKSKALGMLSIIALFVAVLAVHAALYWPFAYHEIIGYFALPPERVDITHLQGPLSRLESNGLFYYWLRLALVGKAPAIASARLLSMLFAVASIPLMYRLGQENGGRVTGVCCAFALGVNMLFLTLASHARFYVVNMFLVVLSTYCLLRACRLQRWLDWIYYALSFTVCVGTMVLSAGTAISHAIIVLAWNSEAKRSLVKPLALVALFIVAFLAVLAVRDPYASQRPFYDDFAPLYAFQAVCCDGALTDNLLPSHFLENQLPHYLYCLDDRHVSQPLSPVRLALGEIWGGTEVCGGGRINSLVGLVSISLLFVLLASVEPIALIWRSRTKRWNDVVTLGLSWGTLLLIMLLVVYSEHVFRVINGKNLSGFTVLQSLVFGFYMGRHRWARWCFCVALLAAPATLYWANAPIKGNVELSERLIALQDGDMAWVNKEKELPLRQCLQHSSEGERWISPIEYPLDLEMLRNRLRTVWAQEKGKPRHLWLFLNNCDTSQSWLDIEDTLRELQDTPGIEVLSSGYSYWPAVVVRIKFAEPLAGR